MFRARIFRGNFQLGLEGAGWGVFGASNQPARGGEMGTTPLPGEIWGFQGGGQEEEGKDLRRLVDPKGS